MFTPGPEGGREGAEWNLNNNVTQVECFELFLFSQTQTLTKVREQHRQEDEPVDQAQERDHQVQTEEEDLDQLSLGERQHHDPGKVRHGNARKHLTKKLRGRWFYPRLCV